MLLAQIRTQNIENWNTTERSSTKSMLTQEEKKNIEF